MEFFLYKEALQSTETQNYVVSKAIVYILKS